MMADMSDPSYPLAQAQQKAMNTETGVSPGATFRRTVQHQRVSAPLWDVALADRLGELGLV